MSKRTFTITQLGLREIDRTVLTSICKLSAARERGYTLVENLQTAEIIVVTAGSENALHALNAKGKPKPIILAGNEPPVDSTHYHLKLPFRASVVLNVLDEITMRALNYCPELSIGNTAGLAKLSDALVQRLSQGDTAKPKAAGDSARHHALIVDDSAPVRAQLQIRLTQLGVEVDAAESGEVGMEMLRRRPYTLVFLDVVMPGIDGYAVCKMIKKNAETRSIPVIMLTSKSSPFDRVKGKLAGCNSYLTKPVEQAEFERVVKPYLHRQETAHRDGRTDAKR